MDLRLLYGISYGHPWLGKWDYKICHGSFGVTINKYEQALQMLSTLELDIIIQDLQNCSIKKIISRYRNLSDTQLEVRDTARLHIGDTGLINFVLKSMINVIVGDYVVQRAVNSCIGVLENDVYKDIAYLYFHVLLDSDSDDVGFVVRTVLDRKNFTKEGPFHDDAVIQKEE
ncbi:hypothetical protein L1887_18718 [Cichorium endivia]|nr:hypothetical protein L1887_18718 [Cichorium endivia]